MVTQVSSILEMIRNAPPLSMKEESMGSIAKKILSSLASSSPLEKQAAAHAISLELQNEASKLQDLQKSFCTILSTPNWKDALLGAHQDEKIDLHAIPLKYSNNLDRPLDLSERSLFFSSAVFSASIGSTFATNKPNRLDDQEHPILDAVYGCSCFDSRGRFDGYALALGDGAGGHFGDTAQDQRIARASHFATKACARLLSAYHHPQTLQQELNALLKHIEKEIQYKAPCESTTLVACRAFPTSQGFRIVGFNVGDCLLMAWNPLTRTAHPLLDSHVSEAGTALLPEAYRSFELQTVDTELPEGSLLFLMSDGIHDTLPHAQEEKTYPNGLQYRIRTLTQLETILGSLPSNAPSELYLRTLIQKTFAGTETLRQQQTSPAIQIGDDFSIIQCHLIKPRSEGCKIS